MKLVDLGNTAFSKRIKKPLPPPITEMPAPLVSEFVTQKDVRE